MRNIINLWIKLSIFPEECKIAHSKALLKKGAKTDPKNYRPISILPLISKMIEQATLSNRRLSQCEKANLHVSVRLQNNPLNSLLSGLVDGLCFNWYE